MIKIGLYVENNNISDVDVTHPENGNPGIGGTEYNFFALPYYFNIYHLKMIHFIFYVQDMSLTPNGIEAKITDNCVTAYISAQDDDCDLFVWRPTKRNDTDELLKVLRSSRLKVIAWVHNTPEKRILDVMCEVNNIIKFVLVSDTQRSSVSDHQINAKACVIYNGFDDSYYAPKDNVQKDHSLVVYVGSIIPAKGFGLLARVWKRVITEYPAAKLYVIGSGQVYNRNKKLGEWGVAEEKYESEEIRPYLSDDAGNVIPSVKFLGVLGKDKIAYMQNACVGIANPTAIGENCPGTAIEFQAAGTPVVSKAMFGLLDTVVNGQTGMLGMSDDELVNNILFFLGDINRSISYGSNGRMFVKRKFDYKKICDQWSQLFFNE